MLNIPKLPLADWIDALVKWLSHFEGFFYAITNFLGGIISAFQWVFDRIPSPVFIILVMGLTAWITRKKIRVGLLVFELIGFLYIWNQGYWRDMTQTLTLVLTASLLAVIIGVPLGLWAATSKPVATVVKPLMDFMQTMPAFVYLIPAVAFFGIGMVPGVVASVIFAMPPTVRMTKLGIEQVPDELIEAADSFGATSWQRLIKVQLPSALPNIMAGINQSMMLALSMVVIASMIGAMGLGTEVYFAVGRNEAGSGFAAGLAIVILAIILDRVTQAMNKAKR